jgi:hypothetical protein
LGSERRPRARSPRISGLFRSKSKPLKSKPLKSRACLLHSKPHPDLTHDSKLSPPNGPNPHHGEATLNFAPNRFL